MEIRLWRELLEPYQMAVDELVTKFRHVKKEHYERGLYSPIESVSGRVKSITSILDKLQKKNIPFEDVETKIEDIAGIRIICQFVEDIRTVAEMIAGRSDIQIREEKDYLSHVKESGYRSYHLVVDYTVETIDAPKTLQVEIQIRTMAMNFWATVEHSMQYKYKANIPEHIRERLSRSADAILAVDEGMSSIREEIMDAQISSQTQQKLVMDILNHIEGLYMRANRREAEKIQDEFYRIYEQKDMEQLERFHKQLDIIAEGYRVQSLRPIPEKDET